MRNTGWPLALVGIALAMLVGWRMLTTDVESVPGTMPTDTAPSSDAAAEPRATASTPGPDAAATTQPDTPEAERSPIESDARATIRGRCIDEQGAPLAGVKLQLSAHEVSGTRAAQYRMEHGAPERTRFEPILSGPDGRFELRFAPLPPLAYGFSALPDDRVRVSQSWPRIEPGSVLDLGDITLPLGVAVQGIVVDSDGAFAPETYVQMTLQATAPNASSEGFRPWRTQSAWTDARGRFVVDGQATAGSYEVSTSPGKVESPTTAVEFARPSADLRIVVARVPQTDGDRIRGVVVDARGQPIPGAMVSRNADGFFGETSSNKDGRFGLRRRANDDDRPAPLFAFADGYAMWSAEQPIAWGTADVRAVLEDGPPLTIRVVRAADGTPIERFGIQRVPVRQNGGFSSRDEEVLFPDRHAGGVLALERATPGRFSITVVPAESTGLGPSSAREVAIELGVPAHVEFRLAPPAERVVELVDARGAPVAGARVELLWHASLDRVHVAMPALRPADLRMNSGDHNAELVARSDSDADGRVLVRGDGERDYVLRLPGPGTVPQLVRPFRLDVAETARVVVATGAKLHGRITPPALLATLREEAALPARGEVSESDAKYLPQVQLRGVGQHEFEIFPAEAYGRNGFAIREDGSFELGGVPPGTWRLALRTWRRSGGGGGNSVRHITDPIELRDGEDRELVVDLGAMVRQAVVLHVEVDGALAYGAAFHPISHFGPGEQDAIRGRADASGAVHVGLPAGTWRANVHVVVPDAECELPGPEFAVRVGPTPIHVEAHLRTAQRQIRLLDPDGAPVRASPAMVVDAGGGDPKWVYSSDANGTLVLLGPPGAKRVSVRRAPLADDDAYGDWIKDHPGPDAWKRAWLEVGVFDLVPGDDEVQTIRLPAAWRELPE